MTSTIRSMSSVGPQRWPPRDYPRRQPAGTLCTIRSAGAQTSATPAAEPDGAVDLDRSAAAFVARTATRALCLRLLRAAPPVRHAAPRVPGGSTILRTIARASPRIGLFGARACLSIGTARGFHEPFANRQVAGPARFIRFLAKATITQQAATRRGTIGGFVQASESESAVPLAPQSRCGRLLGTRAGRGK